MDFYQPEIISYTDYYPFGMVMAGRDSSLEKYRFGFNGKEKDEEEDGEGNQQDYGMRIYKARLGRFLTVDPIFRDYPWNSTYAFSENNSIKYVDLDGREKFDPQAASPSGVTLIQLATVPGGIVGDRGMNRKFA